MRTASRPLWIIVSLISVSFSPGSHAWRLSTGTADAAAQEQPAINSSTNIPTLIKELKSKDEDARENAVSELARIGADAIPALVEFLNHEKGDSRVYAAEALANIDPQNKLADTVLNEIVSKSKGTVLLEAAKTLAMIDPENDVAVAALVKLAAKTIIFPTEKSVTLQHRAMLALATTGPGIRALTQLLRHWDSWVRRAAIFAFDERTETLENGSPAILSAVNDAVPTLVEALKDKDETVRGVAAEVLEQIGTEAIPPLTEAARSGDKKLSSAATEVLERIKKRND